MLRAYVVDDERLAVDRLSRLLDATGRVEIVGASTDPEAALEALRARPADVDVLFLDIQMPNLSGIEVLAPGGTSTPRSSSPPPTTVTRSRPSS